MRLNSGKIHFKHILICLINFAAVPLSCEG